VTNTRIDGLWREYPQTYGGLRIRDYVQTNWGDDPNIVQGKIQFAYAPLLEQLKSQPRIVRVWHPSDYNLSAQREKLVKSWLTLAEEISS
jgi:hypothetical protein